MDETVLFAELIGARVYQGWMSDVNFPVTHPQYLGDLNPTEPRAKDVLKNVDLLIGIGCPMFDQGFFNPEPTLPKGIKLIHIDENPWEIGKNFPVDCGIQGDIRSSLRELNESLEKGMPTETDKAVKTRIRDHGKVRMGFDYEVVDESGRLLVSGFTIHACLNAELKAVRILPKIQEVIDRESGS